LFLNVSCQYYIKDYILIRVVETDAYYVFSFKKENICSHNLRYERYVKLICMCLPYDMYTELTHMKIPYRKIICIYGKAHMTVV
jgi:hypothetical protein